MCTVLIALQILTHLILINILWDGFHCYYTFTDKEIEAQKVKQPAHDHIATKQQDQNSSPKQFGAKVWVPDLPAMSASLA